MKQRNHLASKNILSVSLKCWTSLNLVMREMQAMIQRRITQFLWNIIVWALWLNYYPECFRSTFSCNYSNGLFLTGYLTSVLKVPGLKCIVYFVWAWAYLILRFYLFMYTYEIGFEGHLCVGRTAQVYSLLFLRALCMRFYFYFYYLSVPALGSFFWMRFLRYRYLVSVFLSRPN